MRRALHLLFVSLGVLVSGALLGLAVFAGWLLMAPGGARWLVDWVPRAGLAELQVRGLDGPLVGPLRADSLHLRLPGVEVQVRDLRLDWSATALLQARVRVYELSAAAVEVRITPRETPAPPSTTPPRVPELPFGIELRESRIGTLVLHLPGREAPETVQDLALEEFAWLGETLRLKRLAATHALSGPLQAALDARLEPLRIDVETLSLAGPRDDSVQLLAHGTVQLDGQPSVIDLNWSNLQWPLQGTPQVFSRQGRVGLRGTPEELRAQGRLALGERSELDLDGRYVRGDFDANLRWKDLAWPLAGVPRISSRSGSLSARGRPEAYIYRLDADLAAEGQQGRAQAQGQGGLEQVVLETLRLAVAGSEIEGRADVAWTPSLDVDADLKLRNVDPGLIDPAWPGRLNGRLSARTRQLASAPAAEFELALTDSKLRNYPLALDARGRFAAGQVDLDALSLRSGRSTLTAAGRVTPPLDVRATLDSPDLAALWPGLQGRAQLQASARGPLEAPQVTAQGRLRDLAFGEQRLESLELDADVAVDGAWNLKLLARDLRLPDEVSRIELAVTGAARDHQVQLSASAPAASAELRLQGDFQRRLLSWRGTLEQGRLAPRGLPAWSLEEPAVLRADAHGAALEPACWKSAAGTQGRACVQGLQDPGRVRGAFRVERLDFQDFASLLPAGWVVSGGLSGTGRIELRDGAVAEVRADVETRASQIARDGQVLLRTLPGKLSVEEIAGRAVASLRLPLDSVPAGNAQADVPVEPAGGIEFDGTLGAHPDPAQRPLDGELRLGLTDLGLLRLASEEITRASGRLDGRMRWTGTLQAPVSEGEFRLSEGLLALATPGIEVSQMTARLGTASDGRFDIATTAVSGGGRIQIEGTADVAGPAPAADLRIQGSDFQAANSTEARAWISPDLRLQLAGGRLALSGDLVVPHAEITPVSFESGTGPSSDQVIITGEPEGTSGELRFAADVRIKLGEKVSVDGFGLKTRLTGAVRAVLEPGRADSGFGEVRLVGGRYKAYGQDLEIETGRLLFNGGPLSEPALEIRALRKPREDIEVGVFVRGRLDKPEFQIFSTPTMPRERQLSWLVLGRALDEGSSGDEKALVANAALSLGLSGTDYLAQNLRGGLRLDEISIGAQPGEDAENARFTVGKYLSPKLYVSYGIGIFQPGQVFKLLYDLGRGFKFSSESGVHTGGDLLYTVERP